MEKENNRTPNAQDTQDTKETSEEKKSPAQKLKEENDLLEAEMERAQKIRNEALLAGTNGGNQPTKKASPEEEKVNNAKEAFAGTALGDAISKANE